MSASDYLKDGKWFVRRAAPYIERKMDHDAIINATLFLALGVERVLKHILSSVNPVFVLVKSEFKHSAAALYASMILTTDRNREIADKADGQVISFRTAIQRALIFSEATRNHRSLLYTIARYRDILVHRPTSELYANSVNRMLIKDSFRLIQSFCQEIDAEPIDFLDEHTVKLELLAERIEIHERIDDDMQTLFRTHQEAFVSRRDDDQFMSMAATITQQLLDSTDDHFVYEEIPCPACNETAVARIEPDYDYDPVDRSPFLSGVFVESVRCQYCRLVLKNYEQLDYIDANSILE